MIKKKLECLKERLEVIAKEFAGAPIVVAFSGGKDSTFLLHHVLEYLSERKSNPLVVVYADTLVENPVIHSHAINFLNKVKTYCEEVGIDIRIVIAKPEVRSTYWVNIIGKGYPLPSPRFRWCQDKLKIRPVKKALSEFSDGVMLVAVRMDESQARKRSLGRRLNNMEVNRTHLRTFAPIYDYDEEEIWEFLIKNKTPWGESYSSVVELYRTARGECPLIPEKNRSLNGCGMRFGCWVCSLVKEDKTLKNQAKHDQMLQKLYEFRNWLIEFCNDVGNRLPYRRNGTLAKNGKGVLSIQARKTILEKLLDLEKELGMKLITEEELSVIQEVWNLESGIDCLG